MNMRSSSKDNESRLAVVWDYVGVPERLAHAALDNYCPGCLQQEEALDMCREYARQGIENIRQGRGLLLKGPVGTGKSHLSIATLRAIIESAPDQFGRAASPTQLMGFPEYAGLKCSMVPVFELLERVKRSYNSKERKKDYLVSLIRRCRRDDVVILDDIGAEKPSDWVEEQLYGLIDHRYRLKLATFFTTNCSMAKLENQIGARAVSRIFEMCQGVMVGGEDYRKKTSGQY